MPSEVMLHPPLELVGLERYITEGWDAFFANKDGKDNPYTEGALTWRAWRWGWLEACDYGN